MNTGMQDAFNLGWKLSLAAKGRASARLLGSYEVEREQVGEALLRGTGRATSMVLTRNPLLVALRNRLAPLYLSSSPSALHRLAEALSELDIAYHHSPIARDDRAKKGALQAGDRAPDGMVLARGSSEPQHLFETLNSSRSIVLIFTGQQATSEVQRHWREVEALRSEGYQELIETYLVTGQAAPESGQETGTMLQDIAGELHRRYEAAHGGLLLIRPDGYIGFWGPFGAAGALRAYLQELFV
jgi:hypothetical protein